MKKLILTVFASSILLSCPVMASSLADVAGKNAQAQTQQIETQAQTTAPTQNSSGSINFDTTQKDSIKAISDGADFSADNPVVRDIQRKASAPLSILMQLIAWGITVLVGCSTLLDLAYICIPFTRGLLGGGAGATSATAGRATTGMGNSYNGSFGGNPYGGNHYGGNPYDGGGANSTPVRPAGGSGFCLVSQEAINASTAVDPQTGKVKGALGAYWNTAVVKLIATPILLILTLTGVLQKLGFLIGSIIFNLIRTIPGMS